MGEQAEGGAYLFPAALRVSRLRRSLKQAALAAMLDVPLRTPVSWETGTHTTGQHRRSFKHTARCRPAPPLWD